MPSSYSPSTSPADLRRRSPSDPLRLLVSVRDAEEAIVALGGGVDVIDVKEPTRGALGRADDETLRRIVDAVGGRAVLSFAGGEAIEQAGSSNVAGYSLFKYGPAGLANRADSREILFEAWNSAPRGTSPIAVAYVDYEHANAPAPELIVDLAVEFGCAGVLFDTFGKASRLGLTALPEERMALCVTTVREAGLLVSVAGSLGAEDVTDVRRLHSDLIAMRGAVCMHGRDSRVDARRIAEVREAIARDASSCVDFAAKRREALRSDFA